MGFARDMIRAVADYDADPKSIVEITATDIGGARHFRARLSPV